MGQATELPWLLLPLLYPSLPFPISQVQEKQREQVMPQLASFPSHWADRPTAGKVLSGSPLNKEECAK